MTTFKFYTFFTSSGTAYTGGTVTVDMYAGTGLLTSGSAATSVGGGLYSYSYIGTAGGTYIALFKNNDTACDTLHDAQFSLTDLTVAAIALTGAGANAWTYTLTNSSTGLPVASADVWVTSDLAGTNVLASGVTNASGQVTFYLDSGTVYVWGQRTGFNFNNPDLEAVP